MPWSPAVPCSLQARRLPLAPCAVVKGQTRPIDVVSVLQPPGRRYYSIVSINFGLITNLDIGTEHMRYVGVHPKRPLELYPVCRLLSCSQQVRNPAAPTGCQVAGMVWTLHIVGEAHASPSGTWAKCQHRRCREFGASGFRTDPTLAFKVW